MKILVCYELFCNDELHARIRGDAIVPINLLTESTIDEVRRALREYAINNYRESYPPNAMVSATKWGEVVFRSITKLDE